MLKKLDAFISRSDKAVSSDTHPGSHALTENLTNRSTQLQERTYLRFMQDYIASKEAVTAEVTLEIRAELERIEQVRQVIDFKYDDAQVLETFFEHAPENFTKLLSSYRKFYESKHFQELYIPFCFAVRHASRNLESLSTTITLFTELANNEYSLDPNHKSLTFEFIRGVGNNGWDVNHSLVTFLTCQTKDLELIELIAKSASWIKPAQLSRVQKSQQQQIPPILYLSLVEDLDFEEKNLVRQVLIHYHQQEWPAEKTFQKLSLLFEVIDNIQDLTERGSVQEYIFNKVKLGIENRERLEYLLDSIITNVTRAQSNQNIKDTLVSMGNASSYQDYADLMFKLRVQYQADVVPNDLYNYDPKDITYQEGVFNETVLLQKRLQNYQLALLAMNRFMQVGSMDEMSVLDKFGGELSLLKSYRYADRKAITLRGIDPYLAFKNVDLQAENIFHKYCEKWGIDEEVITQFTGSAYTIVPDNCLIVECSGNSNFQYAGQDYAAVYFFNERLHGSGATCLLVPSVIIKEKLDSCDYPLEDAHRCYDQVDDLFSKNLTYEGLHNACKEHNFPIFDLSSGTCTGGFYNGLDLTTAHELSDFEISPSRSGITSRDPWGRIKKFEVFNSPEFANIKLVNEHVGNMVKNFNANFLLLVNTFSNWANGFVIDCTEIPAEHLNMRMLYEGILDTLSCIKNDLPRSAYPKLTFFDYTQTGTGDFRQDEMMPQIDFYDMTLTLDGRTWTLPPLRTNLSEIEYQQYALDYVADPHKVKKMWSENIFPRISETLPSFVRSSDTTKEEA